MPVEFQEMDPRSPGEVERHIGTRFTSGPRSADSQLSVFHASPLFDRKNNVHQEVSDQRLVLTVDNQGETVAICGANLLRSTEGTIPGEDEAGFR